MTDVSANRSEDLVVHTSPHSLVISPNLDALLEHDERTRRHANDHKSPDILSVSAPSGTEVFLGLPPPPRGPRKSSFNRDRSGRPHTQRLKTTPSSSFLQVDPDSDADSPSADSTPTSNPFINPAPTIEVILKADASVVPPSISATKLTSPESSLDSFGRRPFMPVKEGVQRSRSATSSRSRTPESPYTNTQMQENALLLPRIQGKAKYILGIFDTPDTQTTTNENSAPLLEHRADPNRPKAPRRRGKLVKPKDISTETSTARVSGALGNNNPQVISHAHHPRSSSSSQSSRSDSIQGPSSTGADEPFITTSSARYTSPNSSHGYHSPITSEPFDDNRHTNRNSHEFSTLPDYSPSSQASSRKISETDYSHLTSVADQRIKSPKPLLPTSPKPIFNRTPSGQLIHRKISPSPSTNTMNTESSDSARPPTTNLLNPDERADRIRKTRKLAQVFGSMPGVDALANQDPRSHLAGPSRSHHQRGALSMSVESSSSPRSAIWPPTEGTQYITPQGRRHSSPWSTDDLPFLSDQSRQLLGIVSPDVERARHTTYSDLSDDETNDNINNMTEEKQAEEDRRRKREKLVKLHRFLGSQVPVGLVLGVSDVQPVLPPLASNVHATEERDVRRPWLRRRRSSSALPTSWSGDIDRLKEDLDDREKAVNVRRAVKMEKLFGELPPQTLYHTRHYAAPSATQGPVPTSSAVRNPPRAEHQVSSKRKNTRPDTTDSETLLLSHGLGSDYDFTSPPPSLSKRQSDVYFHYQHSLNSLHDIIDRDDKHSLAQLHHYLHSDLLDVPESPPDLGTAIISTSPTSKSERRRSLPTTMSTISVSSLISVTSPIEVTEFELRRRKAAKLTQFFGVDYRDLIEDVLESIEKGVGEERRRGTLAPGEADALLQKLRELRSKPSFTL